MKEYKELKDLPFIQINSSCLRRYVNPINIIVPTENGGTVTATNKVTKGMCQVVNGMGIYPIKVTDEQLDAEFEDVIMIRKTDLVEWLNSKKKSK